MLIYFVQLMLITGGVWAASFYLLGVMLRPAAATIFKKRHLMTASTRLVSLFLFTNYLTTYNVLHHTRDEQSTCS